MNKLERGQTGHTKICRDNCWLRISFWFLTFGGSICANLKKKKHLFPCDLPASAHPLPYFACQTTCKGSTLKMLPYFSIFYFSPTWGFMAQVPPPPPGGWAVCDS